MKVTHDLFLIRTNELFIIIIIIFSRCDNYIASGSVNNQISIFDMRKPEKPVYVFLHDSKLKKKNPKKKKRLTSILLLLYQDARQDNDRFIAPDAGIGISGMYWMKSNNILITAGGDCAVRI